MKCALCTLFQARSTARTGSDPRQGRQYQSWTHRPAHVAETPSFLPLDLVLPQSLPTVIHVLKGFAKDLATSSLYTSCMLLVFRKAAPSALHHFVMPDDWLGACCH